MTVAATDLRRSPAGIDVDQEAEPRRRDGFEAIGLVAGIFGLLFLLAATVGTASPADRTATAGTQPSAPAQVEWVNLSPPK